MPVDSINYLDYYNLLDVNVIKKQAEIAQNYGIYGFSIYYYWFCGKKAFEKPLDLYLNNENFDFPFLLI